MTRDPQFAPVLLPGQQIGGCRIERMIGSGGMGEVYLAQHLRLQRRVALKTLRSDSISKERIARFVKEARVCASIEHSNVVTIHDVDQQAGLHFIVMQYVEGKDLDQLVKEQGGPLPWRSALRLIRLAAKGLQAVHQRGLIHRDIKPSNIMLSRDSRVLLMDFGLAREESHSDLTQMSQVVGTPAFMSPEQFRNSGIDARSDIYSLGCTLYCLLTGRLPYTGRAAEVYAQLERGKRPRPVCDLNPRVPREVSALVEKSIALRPADRYTDAAAFCRAISQLLKSTQLTESASADPSESSASALEPIPELLPLDLVPIDTSTWETVRDYMPWIAGTTGVAVLIGIALVINLIAGPEPKGRAAPAAKLEHPGMVYIEAGTIQLGNDATKLRAHFARHPLDEEDDFEKVMRLLTQGGKFTLQVPGFWIDKYEVTNREYSQFLKQTQRSKPEHWESVDAPAGQENHPVENVSYKDAMAYAQWSGKKLPTREQWMRAFRGDKDWLFPWGDEYAAGRTNVLDNKEIRRRETTPVDATPADVSQFGVYNLVGNVAEKIQDASPSPVSQPHVYRGGSYGYRGYVFGIADSELLGSASDTSTGMSFGFRCVVEDPASKKPDKSQ